MLLLKFEIKLDFIKDIKFLDKDFKKLFKIQVLQTTQA